MVVVVVMMMMVVMGVVVMVVVVEEGEGVVVGATLSHLSLLLPPLFTHALPPPCRYASYYEGILKSQYNQLYLKDQVRRIYLSMGQCMQAFYLM